MAKPKTLAEAIRYFANEENCIRVVAEMRWPHGPACPACGHMQHYWLESQKRWKCKECWKQFSVKVGTIFEDSPIALDKWLIALWMLVNCKNGVSSYELSRTLGITQKSAWFVLHRLRLALQSGSLDKFGGPNGEVEADESYIGAKAKNMHKSRKLRMRQERNKFPDWKAGKSSPGSLPNKTPVAAILDREQRKVRAKVYPYIKRDLLQKEILENVHHGTNIYTDESPVYHGLSDKYAHSIVNHIEKYVDGKVHTNGLENFWSLLKRGLNGTYVAVEPFHLFRYVDEQVFRYNNRGSRKEKVSDSDRFELALSQIAGKRLTFAEVTGKVGVSAF